MPQPTQGPPLWPALILVPCLGPALMLPGTYLLLAGDAGLAPALLAIGPLWLLLVGLCLLSADPVRIRLGLILGNAFSLLLFLGIRWFR
nr:hypothetical protein [uncultured Holophaga sp.]